MRRPPRAARGSPREGGRGAAGAAPRPLYPDPRRGNAPQAEGGERLALFGGSFDPVHRGHLHAAEAARGAFRLDSVVLMPAARSPHKAEGPATPGAVRARLIEIAIRGRPGLEVSSMELERGGPSYTIDTVRALLAARRPRELFLLLGTDNLPGLPEWRAVGELLSLARPIVVHRGGDARAALRALAGRLAPEHLEALGRGLLLLPPVEISATELRARLARGEDPGEDLPPGVLDEIRARGLYGWPA